jgi:hypothetical protein
MVGIQRESNQEREWLMEAIILLALGASGLRLLIR